MAVALKQARTPEFKMYQQQVVVNCRVLCQVLSEHGYDIVTGMRVDGCLNIVPAAAFLIKRLLKRWIFFLSHLSPPCNGL